MIRGQTATDFSRFAYRSQVSAEALDCLSLGQLDPAFYSGLVLYSDSQCSQQVPVTVSQTLVANEPLTFQRQCAGFVKEIQYVPLLSGTNNIVSLTINISYAQQAFYNQIDWSVTPVYKATQNTLLSQYLQTNGGYQLDDYLIFGTSSAIGGTEYAQSFFPVSFYNVKLTN